MSRRAEFEAEHPEVHVLSADQAGRVDLVMGAVGWLGDEEQVTTCASLGGESSTVMRVELQELRGGWRTAVLKQSLPWLRRDESIAMPTGRWSGERAFYAEVARVPEVAARMPRLMAANEARFLLLLEDFRGAPNLVSLYRGGSLADQAASALGAFLGALRRGTRGQEEPDRANTGMKALNHRLLFEAPFASSMVRGDGFGPDGPAPESAALDATEPGLGEAAAALRSDRVFGEAVSELGSRFLGAGACLVHGAFHPANWLVAQDGGVRVVDPQYGGWGDSEFDIGTGLAHLLLARQPAEVVAAFLAAAVGLEEAGGEEPGDAEGGEPGVDRPLVARYAGVEIVRRLIGGGQLPLEAAELSEPEAGFRCGLLETARKAVLSGRLEVLET
ncbi:MAG: phosphotransferase [Acidobacteriota bacterium]|nr:phosphotransferase [Acidobacteriota bacterium]MDE3265035.1 phosphotransferase [Acidobacteriota bacterium]